MTDNDIIKALELCHIGGDDVCLICPYAGLPHCCWLMDKDAIDLIFRQKAEIEALKSANEKMHEASKWIRVEEQLPINMGTVLVHDCSNGRSSFAAYIRNNWIAELDFTVTHWKPIPEPPKGE